MSHQALGRQFEGMRVQRLSRQTFLKHAYPGEPVDAGKDWAEVQSRGGYDDLRSSIAQRGLERPILMDMTTGEVKDGHHRAAALLDLNASHIPVVDYNEHGWPKGYA